MSLALSGPGGIYLGHAPDPPLSLVRLPQVCHSRHPLLLLAPCTLLTSPQSASTSVAATHARRSLLALRLSSVRGSYTLSSAHLLRLHLSPCSCPALASRHPSTPAHPPTDPAWPPHNFSGALYLERWPPSVLARNSSYLRFAQSPCAPCVLSTPLVLLSHYIPAPPLEPSTIPADMFATVISARTPPPILPCLRQRRNGVSPSPHARLCPAPQLRPLPQLLAIALSTPVERDRNELRRLLSLAQDSLWPPVSTFFVPLDPPRISLNLYL
ncbi:hypothetical protein K438DRAFT_2023030 [Mycena galopus ATCC 62051]|nr:hypothetical protein K438DRAFT_2023030 [Mycena galopus ATCC 62051]